jgi:hypothetical protein
MGRIKRMRGKKCESKIPALKGRQKIIHKKNSCPVPRSKVLKTMARRGRGRRTKREIKYVNYSLLFSFFFLHLWRGIRIGRGQEGKWMEKEGRMTKITRFSFFSSSHLSVEINRE